ncbi:MAG: leucyl aminopeptidase family protein [Pseudomonadota bacterium]
MHVVIEGAALESISGSERLLAALKRKRMKSKELAKSPVTCENGAGGLESWLVLAAKASVFDRHAALRKALQPLLDEQPSEIHIAVHGAAAGRLPAAEAAVYVAWLNGTSLPSYKSKQSAQPLKKIYLHGCQSADGFARARALAEGNALTRQLTMLPPNELTPASYRQRVARLARAEGWGIEEYDVKKLRKLRAGAFLAVARGSQHEDAAIVHLSYAPKRAKGHYALVGKGICFDTGGHNLKPARYMHNMHDDMNGSAVALGLLLAATRLKLPVRLDVWLAIAQNHLSPEAYTQNEVVTALNGTTIEIVHTDAEGRMVLADTLTLAARAKPAAIIDFATLTGSMTVALGERMSGVLANRDALAAQAVAAGLQCGERVVAFPVPEDYDEALESKLADIKQCTLDGEADHILAARFLNRFVADTPWLHVDLSASRCKGGLGAVGSDITGFGVGLGLGLLERLTG